MRLEDAADMLLDPASTVSTQMAERYVQMVAESQGKEAGSKPATMRLLWWQANGPLYVRAKDVERLRPHFLKWCGKQKRGRGRPKGTTKITDDILIERAIQLLRDGTVKFPTTAARRVAVDAVGASPEANYDRLRRKIVKRWRELGEK